MYNPKISVIVPVYNVEKYLSRCIDSILAQTFTDFELLLIDDGSNDNSGNICDDYVKKDNRIRVFHKENGGVSSARNLGLNKAKGEWICFVDSDDTVSVKYLYNMSNFIRYEDMLILSNYRDKDKSDCIIKLDNVTLYKDEIVRYFIANKVLTLSGPCSKLFNNGIIRKYSLRFPDSIQMGEDTIFLIRYLNCVSLVTIVDVCDYLVWDTKGSLSSKYYSFENEWNCYKILKSEILTFLTRFGQVYDNPIKIAWENRTGDTFNRCLQCLYRQEKSLSFSEKLKYLDSIPLSDIKEFSLYYNPKKVRRKLLKFLIVNHLYYLYIIAGNFDKFK